MSALEVVMMKRIGELNEEVKRLKAEVELQNERINLRDEDVGRLYCENARLKAEVERLAKELSDEKSANANVEARQNSANRGLSMDNFNLKAEVERLRKAGDAVVNDLEYLTKSGWFNKCKSVKRWNAAKDGRPE